MKLQTKIVRIGNSKGIIIPHSIIRALALEEGDLVSLTYQADSQTLLVNFLPTKQLKLDVK